jgi:hypothetical protein
VTGILAIVGLLALPSPAPAPVPTIAKNQLRPATLEGNRLTLSDGGKTFRVVWERVP